MSEKLITKSFERILEKGKNRGFITYEELGKSLGKRGGSFENTERAFLIIADHKITLVEKKSEIGLFFLNHSDAEKYLKEVARSDYEGTQTLGLSVNCISLSSAYKITREHHPGVDFRLTPNFSEVKQLLNNIGNSDHIVEKEQQQLRRDHDHWKRQAQVLQLEVLRLKDMNQRQREK